MPQNSIYSLFQFRSGVCFVQTISHIKGSKLKFELYLMHVISDLAIFEKGYCFLVCIERHKLSVLISIE